MILDPITYSAFKKHQIIAHTRENASFQIAVLDKDTTTIPGSPTIGDRYLILSGWGGGHDDEIAEYTKRGWQYFSPDEGWRVWVQDEQKEYLYSSAVWAVDEVVVQQTWDYIVSNVSELDAALSAITTNESIYLLPGTYDKGSPFVLPIVSGMFIASNGNATIVRPNAGHAFTFASELNDIDYFKMSGLRFNGSSKSGFYNLFWSNRCTIKNGFIENCIFYDNPNGGALDNFGYDTFEIRGNTFKNVYSCIDNLQGPPPTSVKFFNTRIHNNYFNPVGSTSRCLAVYANTANGILYPLLIHDNIFYSNTNTTAFIFMSPATNQIAHSIKNNSFYNTGASAGWMVFLSTGGNLCRGVVSNNNYYLSSSSMVFTNYTSDTYNKIFDNYTMI